MKFLFYGILIIALIFLVFQLYNLVRQQYALQKQLRELVHKTQPVSKENEKLTAQLHALQNPENLERELRRAGYAAPGEKVFIIVPKHSN